MTHNRIALPDVNVLVAITVEDHVHHRRALEWLSSAPRYATTPITEAGLVRLLLNPAITGREVGLEDALTVLKGLRSRPGARFLPDDSSLTEPKAVLPPRPGHQQVTDLHLLNLAARHDATLVTFDAKIEQQAGPGPLVMTLR